MTELEFFAKIAGGACDKDCIDFASEKVEKANALKEKKIAERNEQILNILANLQVGSENARPASEIAEAVGLTTAKVSSLARMDDRIKSVELKGHKGYFKEA